MRPIRRTIAMLAALLLLAVPALGAAGCGSGGHYLGGVVAHHVINHFVHSQKGLRRVNKVFCVYHGHRVLVDLRTHHVFAAGLNAIAAYRSCKAGFGRRH